MGSALVLWRSAKVWSCERLANMDPSAVRPIILAGGLGTRLRPRTLELPKPLLPVDGRPLLWYALNTVRDFGFRSAIVTLDYKASLIEAYFDGFPDVEFKRLPGRTMAQSFLEVARADNAELLLGMSSDVLVPQQAVTELVKAHKAHSEDAVLFVTLPEKSHKKWDFRVAEGYLVDVGIHECNTNHERVLILFTRQSVMRLAEYLGPQVAEETVPAQLRGYQTGWILLMKSLLALNIPVAARFVDIPVCNLNTPDDFAKAEAFVRLHFTKART